MGSNPTAPMVREANRGAVIPTAGGERRLGQGWVCGGQIPPLFKCLSPERTTGTSIPTCVLSVSVMVREANRGAVIQSAVGERGLGQGRVCGGQIPLLQPPPSSRNPCGCSGGLDRTTFDAAVGKLLPDMSNKVRACIKRNEWMFE